MRDRSKARNYSPSREAFRRDHECRRRHGLVKRHAEKLCRLHGCTSRCAAAGLHDQGGRIPPLIWDPEFTSQQPPRQVANQHVPVTSGPAPDLERCADRPGAEEWPPPDRERLAGRPGPAKGSAPDRERPAGRPGPANGPAPDRERPADRRDLQETTVAVRSGPAGPEWVTRHPAHALEPPEDRCASQETAVPDGKPPTAAQPLPARRPGSATRSRLVAPIGPAARNKSAVPADVTGPGESDDPPGLACHHGSVAGPRHQPLTATARPRLDGSVSKLWPRFRSTSGPGFSSWRVGPASAPSPHPAPTPTPTPAPAGTSPGAKPTGDTSTATSSTATSSAATLERCRRKLPPPRRRRRAAAHVKSLSTASK